MALRTLKRKPNIQALIDAHNQDPEAHPELNSILDFDERLSALEDSLLEGETQNVTPPNSITINAQNVYIGYNGSVDIQPPDEFFDDIPEDELEQYGIKKARRRKAYKLLKTYNSLDQEKIDYGWRSR